MSERTIVILTLALLAVGLSLMIICTHVKTKKLQKVLLTGVGSPIASVWWPWLQVMQGLVVMVAVLFLASLCVVGRGQAGVSIALSYLSCLLSGIGTFLRSRADVKELGIAKEEHTVLWCLGGFCAGMSLFLVSLLTLGLFWFPHVPWLPHLMVGSGS